MQTLEIKYMTHGEQEEVKDYLGSTYSVDQKVDLFRIYLDVTDEHPSDLLDELIEEGLIEPTRHEATIDEDG